MGKKTFDEGKRFDGFTFDPTALKIIGVDTKDGPEHPLWDERIKLPLDESMVVSIMSIGVKDPIIVHKDAETGNPVVIDGRRRVLHAREANKRLAKLGEPLVRIPAVQEKGSEDHLVHVSVALNEIRRQDDVLVKAAKAQRMLSRGHDEADVAIAFGVHKATIRNWTKLMELPSDVKKAVSSGVLSSNAASKLHGMSREDQKAALQELSQQHQETGKKVTGTQVAKKNPNAPRAVKPGKKDVIAAITVLTNEGGEFNAGVVAGLRYMLGEKVPELAKILEG